MLPVKCPSCQRQLKVKNMVCEECATEVSGLYDLPPLTRLSAEDQQFILRFIKCSGSLKDMARQMELSYPTVRNILDEIIERVEIVENKK